MRGRGGGGADKQEPSVKGGDGGECEQQTRGSGRRETNTTGEEGRGN